MQIARNCPQCGGGLGDTQGKVRVDCPYCGVEVELSLGSAAGTARMMERRQEIMPTIEKLMAHYAEHLGSGRAEDAFPYMEAVHYLTLSMSYEVEALEELEATATPLARETARQLGLSYRPPSERGSLVTYAYVRRLAERD